MVEEGNGQMFAGQQKASAEELGRIGTGRVRLERQVPEQLKSPESGTQCCECSRESVPFLVVKHLFLSRSTSRCSPGAPGLAELLQGVWGSVNRVCSCQQEGVAFPVLTQACPRGPS